MSYTNVQVRSSARSHLFETAPFGPAVLEPRLDLSLRELQPFGQALPLGRGQVLLAFKLLLQLDSLVV